MHKFAHTCTELTKKGIGIALRGYGLAGSPANITRTLELRELFEDGRMHRILLRAEATLGAPILRLPTSTGRAAVKLPAGTPAARLKSLRERTVKAYAQKVFRSGARGGTSFAITFASVSSKVSYQVQLGTNRDVYCGAYKGCAARTDTHKICLPADWRCRAERRGLAILSGMMTLDVMPMEAPDGISLFAAVGASQSRGYAVITERGFIATGGGESFHAATADSAIKGLLRKAKSTMDSSSMLKDLISSTELFASKYAGIEVSVSLDDARNSGSCEYGIRSWCDSVAIDISRGEVPMAELMGGFRRLPLTEVRRAALYAIRKCRNCAASIACVS